MQTDGSDFNYGGGGGHAMDKFTRVSDTFPGAVGSALSAKTALNNLLHSNADYTVKGSFETKVANVEAEQMQRWQGAFNLISETTGVKQQLLQG